MRKGHGRIVLGLYRSGHRRETLENALDLGVQHLDTAFNYRGFTSHATLRRTAGDLLDKFTISTKVGFFPGGSHSLEPDRLRKAIERSVSDLDRSPDVVFLHNPEHTLRRLASPEAAHAHLEGACKALADSATTGTIGGWGISSWNPVSLVPALQRQVPQPDVLMIRAGLTVAGGILDATDTVSALLGIDAASRWGMAPFAGTPDDPIWASTSPAFFLRPHQTSTSRQSGLAVALHLPVVARIAVGADHREHLAELLAATQLTVDTDSVTNYRTMISQRATVAR